MRIADKSDKPGDRRQPGKSGLLGIFGQQGRRGKFKNTRVITGIIVFVIAAAVFAAAKLVFQDADAREFYFKAESKNFEKYSAWIEKNYTGFREKQKPFMEGAYRRRTEITADIQSGGEPFGLKDAGRLFDLIKRSKLVVDTRRQPQEGTAASEVDLLIEKAPFMDAELFTRDRMMYFTVPVLMPEKYFSVNLDKIDEVYDKFSIPVKPKRLVNGADIAQTLQFERKAFDESFKNLGKVFSGVITADTVKYGEDREITLSGKAVKGKEVRIALDEASVSALLDGIAAFVGSDDTLLSYTYGNFADLSAMLDDAGLFRLFSFLDESGVVVLNDSEKGLVDTLNVRKDTEGFRKLIQETLDGCTLKDGLNMAVVIDRDGNILDRRLTANLETKDVDKAYKIDLNTGSTVADAADCRNRFIKAVVTETAKGVEGGTVEFQMTSLFDKADGADTAGNVVLSWNVAPRDGPEYGTDINLDITGGMDPQTLKRNDITGFKVKLYGEGGDGSMEGEVSKVSWKNKKLNTEDSTTKITVRADLPSFGIKDLSAEVNLAREDSLGIEPFTLPDLQQKQVADLNAASGKELERIKMEAAASFGSFYLTNKPVFDALLGQ